MSDTVIKESPAERHKRRLREERLQKMVLSAVARTSTAEDYSFRSVRLPDNAGGPDWLPVAQHCHANVDIWVHRSPAHKRAKGFVLIGPEFGVWRVLAHSLVELEDGTLIDITPQSVSEYRFPFVRHIGTDKEFEEFENQREINVCRPA
jgi:hypothetical protein